MTRLYRLAALVLACLVPVSLAAQNQSPSAPATPAVPLPVPPPLGSTFPGPTIAALPSENSLFGLIDSAQSELIADRIDTGGLSTGEPARIGAHGSSWTQTAFRIGEVDITDPEGRGAPMLVPDLVAWDRVTAASGHLPIDVNAPGLELTLLPRKSTPAWTRTIEGYFGPSGLQAGAPANEPPPIQRLDSWANVNALVGGPLVPGRVGLMVAGSWTNSSRFDLNNPAPFAGSLGSVFANIDFTPSADNDVRVVGWFQRSRAPRENLTPFGTTPAAQRSNAFHAQTTWDRMLGARTAASIFGGYSVRGRDSIISPSPTIVVDRLEAGPIQELINPKNGTTQQWIVGARLTPSFGTLFGRPQSLLAGVEFGRGSSSTRPDAPQTIGELVGGMPARVWQYIDPGRDAHLSSKSFALYGSDTVQLFPWLSVGGGLRFESLHGSAEGAATGIDWNNTQFRASIVWNMPWISGLRMFGDIGRYDYRLPLDYLQYGDPASPTFNVYRWNAASGAQPPQPADIGPLIERVGPGTGGNPQFSAVDPNIQRPTQDEVRFGWELQRGETFLRFTGVLRKEEHLVQAVNVGVPLSSYSVIYVVDPGEDIVHPKDQLLPVYNRLPSSFGADRYLLTNIPTSFDAWFEGLELTAQTRIKKLLLLAGATAGKTSEPAGNRNFRALENDQGVVGEMLWDPNATTFADGRVFTERGYTAKLSGIYPLPADFQIGFIARYQDGQHFSRLVIVPGLNQGADPVRAFPNGKTRFTFTSTLDTRLEKAFRIGSVRLDAVLDVYNLLNLAYEIEEYPVTGPLSRTTTAVQPPLATHFGVRITF